MRLLNLIVLCGALLLLGCDAFTEPEVATKLLESQGYTHIQITGYKALSCGDDTFATGFTAVNPMGHEVSGVVCAGFNKDSTIRFDDPR